jgi:hypothetical protein
MKPRYHLIPLLSKNISSLLASLGLGLVLLWPCSAPRISSAAEAPAPGSPTNGAGSSNEAFVAFGKISDVEGRPLGGVEVIAHSGNGSLQRTGSTVSGANGEYRLSFGPGVRMGRLLGAGPLGIGFQAATISAHKRGYFMQGLGQVGNLAMTDSTNMAPAWSTNFAGVVRPFHPFRLDFCLQSASLVRGHMSDPSHQLPSKVSLCLRGEKLPPSSSVLACVDLDKNGEFEFADVPVGFAWWFEVSWREQEAWKTLRSEPITASLALKTVKITVLNTLEVEQLQ